jgi:hypothetical protein
MHPTHAGVDSPSQPESRVPGVWHLRYRNSVGQWCKARANTQQIIQRLREGRLPATVEGSQTAEGAYLPLAAYPEFRQFQESETGANHNGANGRHRRKWRRSSSLEPMPSTWWSAWSNWILLIAVVSLSTVAAIICFAVIR